MLELKQFTKLRRKKHTETKDMTSVLLAITYHASVGTFKVKQLCIFSPGDPPVV